MISKLEIQEIPCNDCNTLRLGDNSFYNPDLKAENCIIEITPPGGKYAIVKRVEPEFNVIFNSSNLKIVPAKHAAHLVELPDGIYNIKYSIKPNVQINVEYSLLRNCRQLQRYYNAICGLFSEKCELTKKQFEEKRRALIWIKELIDAAKWKVEECGEEREGMELYNQATSLLNEFNDCGCK